MNSLVHTMPENPVCRTADHFVTFTLQPKLRRLSAWEQFDCTSQHINKKLRQCYTNVKLTLIAELHRSFDIHYHGIFSCDLPLTRKSLAHTMRQLFRTDPMIGRLDCQQMVNHQQTVDYIIKNCCCTAKEIARHPVVVDDYKLSLPGILPLDNTM